ncbi:glutathione S-transferase family protein [Methylobacterium nonmethylotrophicum]|uniref:Glutathione S-transferase family protein n=1 Tax=Methylobacterium nonmethylotrophicum TaxID=1141884 RepID=A0A4Z0NSF0_9HYPH|nr:glutathione S-transferase family protein [Methylobacterium nonmethylotrophicum]TGE00193.1 glutathione S-transferase family protein [Methylobacterium nonmethylotrophicum]
MAEATLTISSRNYSSWSLRGWLLCRMAGLDFTVEVLSGDPASRAELLHLTPSFLVPRLTHGGVRVWDVLAIAQYLTEVRPEAGLLPDDLAARSWSRSISGEMHGGFINLRSALPMNLRARYTDFKLWGGAQADIARVVEIWQEALKAHGGPYLFGKRPMVADAMYAPVCTRFVTYGVDLPPDCAAYRDTIMDWDLMREWIAAAEDEPEEIEELDMEF